MSRELITRESRKKSKDNRPKEAQSKEPEPEKEDSPYMIVEEHPEPLNMPEKKKLDSRVKNARKSNYLKEHPETNRKNVRISKIKRFLDTNNLPDISKELYEKGITKQKDILKYLLDKNKEPEKETNPKSVQN